MTATAPLASMTGYGRAGFTLDGAAWSLELRSVNGKALDVKARLPQGCEAVEPEVRAAIGRRLHRGNVSVSGSVGAAGPAAGVSGWKVNRALLAELTHLSREMSDGGPVRIESLLAVRGVVEPDESGGAPLPATLAPALLACLDQALDALIAARTAEGARLAAVLTGQIDTVAALAAEARGTAAVQPAQRRARLDAQLAELLAARPPVAEERLAAELALQLTRSDVREELDRLDAHVEAARALLAKGGPVGRSLDFLAQEFNREANTLCSKASDIELTRIGLALKGNIDQFREQVQNLE